MQKSSSRSVFYAIVALVAVLASVSLSYRVKVEQGNRTVALCMDLPSLQDAASSSGRTLDAVLRELQKRGLSAVAVSAEPLSRLLQRQDVLYDVSGSPFLAVRGQETAERVRYALTARFGEGPWSSPPAGSPPVQMIPVAGLSYDSIASVSLGISRTDAKAVTDAGLLLVARHGNPSGATPRYIEAMLTLSSELGASAFLPEGDQVLGQRDLLEVTADILEARKMLYASPEFSKVGGDAWMMSKCRDRLVLVHSIQAAEQDKMSRDAVLDRFEKAYRERNIRLLLVRPLSAASEDPVRSVGDLLDDLAGRIRQSGGRIGVPRPFTDPAPPRLLVFALGLATAAAVAWVGLQLFENRWVRGVGLFFVAGLAAASWTPTGREFLALAAAVAFPIGGFLTIWERFRPILDFARVSLISLVGGLAVAGLLVGLPYMMRIDQFMGVKAAHVLPVLVVGLIIVGRISSWQAIARQPVLWGAALIALASLAIVGLMVVRTGNDAPAAVSGLEMQFRGLLDTVLFARPRTKEFLLGHPAMLLGLFLLADSVSNWNGRNLTWAGLLLTIGMVGQASIVNTLCHLHTPLEVSLARIAIGWVLGGILGALLWALFRAKRPAKRG